MSTIESKVITPPTRKELLADARRWSRLVRTGMRLYYRVPESAAETLKETKRYSRAAVACRELAKMLAARERKACSYAKRYKATKAPACGCAECAKKWSDKKARERKGARSDA